MDPKWCSCRDQDAAVCASGSAIQGMAECFCACHRVEARPVGEVEEAIRAAFEGKAKVTCDRAADPVAPSFLTVKDERSEINVEYEPGVGFSLELVGWGPDGERHYDLKKVVERVQHLLDGGL